MRSANIVVVFLCSVLSLMSFLASSSPSHYHSEEVLLLPELTLGRWVLLFLIDGYPVRSESSLSWLTRVSTAFPELRFLVVIPRGDSLQPSTEAILHGAASVDVLVDPDGLLAASLGLSSYPACLVSVDGVFVRELLWPFEEIQLIRILAESLLVEVHFPDPTELIGVQAPDFEYEDEEGVSHSLVDLPFPLLLTFINPDCCPCLDVLPLGSDTPRFLSIAIILAATQAAIDETQLQRLTALRQDLGAERTAIAFTSRDTLVAYSIARSPTLVLVDTTGTIVWIAHGVLDRKMVTIELQAAIAAMDNFPGR